MLLIEDVVMNTNDDTNGRPSSGDPLLPMIVGQTRCLQWTRRRTTHDIFAPLPAPQQTIWPRVWPGL